MEINTQPSNTPPPLADWVRTLHLEGITQRAVVPLLRQGRLMGVVGLYAKGLTQFDEEQLRLLREMAGDIEFALNQLAASERLQETEQKAQLLELRFQEVFRASPVPMQIMALNEHRTRAINDAHLRWLGCSLEDIASEEDWFRLAYHDGGERQEMRADWQRKVELVRSSGQTAQSPEMTTRRYVTDSGGPPIPRDPRPGSTSTARQHPKVLLVAFGRLHRRQPLRRRHRTVHHGKASAPLLHQFSGITLVGRLG